MSDINCPISHEELEEYSEKVSEERASYVINEGITEENPLNLYEEEEKIDEKLIALHQKQILSLKNRKLELIGEKDTIKKDVIWANIETIKRSIEALQKEVSYNNIINVALRDLKEVNSILNKSKFSGRELIFIEATLNRIVILDEAIDKNMLDAEYRKKLQHTRTESLILLEKWKIGQSTNIENQSVEEGIPMTFERMNAAVKDISKTTLLFLGMDTTIIPILRLMDSRFETTRRKTNDAMFIFNKEFDAISAKYKDKDAIKKFLDASGRLITETKGSYFDEEKLMLTKVSTYLESTFKPNTTKSAYNRRMMYNHRDRWYMDRNNYTLTAEGEAIYNARLDSLKERLAMVNEDELLSPDDEAYIRHWENSNSPYLGLAYANTGVQTQGNNFWYRYLNQSPKAEFINPEFNKIKDDDLYKFVVNTITNGMKKIPHRMLVDLNSFDKVLNSILFDFNKEDTTILKRTWEGMGNWMNSTFRKAITQQDISGYSGKATDEKGNPKEKVYPKEIGELQKERRYTNPLDLIKDFYQLATAYEHKSEIEPDIWLLKGLLDKQKAIRVNKGITIHNMGDPSVIEGGLTNAKDLALYNILSELYGKRRLDAESNPPTEKEATQLKIQYRKWEILRAEAIQKGLPIPEEPILYKLSGVKVIDAIIDYTRINLMFLKPLSAIVNLTIGLENNFLHAARKIDFTDKELYQALRILGNSALNYTTLGKIPTSVAKKIKKANEVMGISEESFIEDSQTYTSKIAKFGLTWQTSGEYILASQLLIAKMKYERPAFLNGDNLWDAFDDDFNFNTEKYGELDPLYIKKIKDRVREIRKQTQGDYQSTMGIKSTVSGRVLMMFRTWLPRAIHQRFGAEIEGQFKGRYTTWRDVGQAYTEENGFWKGMGSLAGGTMLTLLTKIANIPGFSQLGMKSLSELCEEKYEKDLKKLGLTDLDIQNMRVNIRELQYIIYMSLILMTLAALAGKEPPDKEMNMTINTLTRLYQDMTFFYSFNSITAITKDPIPLYKTIRDGHKLVGNMWNYLDDPQSDIYKRGRHEGGSKTAQSFYKMVPGLSSYQSTLNTMDQIFSNRH